MTDQLPLTRELLLIADLSGYTGYLTNSEPAEAPKIAGDLVGTVLGVLAGHAMYDPDICRKVSSLLSNPNFFISRQAFDFLRQAPIPDGAIRKKMENFRKEHGLD